MRWWRIAVGVAISLLIGGFHFLHGSGSLAATLAIIAAVVVLMVIVEVVAQRTRFVGKR